MNSAFQIQSFYNELPVHKLGKNTTKQLPPSPSFDDTGAESKKLPTGFNRPAFDFSMTRFQEIARISVLQEVDFKKKWLLLLFKKLEEPPAMGKCLAMKLH
ncbi:hypothetical protein M5K25_002784 [Dendrobium thyrsiflorum]|uniref:Uncharacterized protein n=1 Tax=Dendrobium thyrsiflorum TaxID=117978 RepID=A0ABD0VUR1_DENTH